MTITTWDDVAKTINFSLEPRIENIILRLSKKTKILDFGCGYGRISQKICVCEFAVVEEKSYSSDGTFCSTMGIPMKHFHRAELEKELECFSHSETKVFDAESLGGSPAQAILFAGEKREKAST